MFKNKQFTRSPVPILSCLSKNKIINYQHKVYPFGKNSIFEYLLKNNGTIVLFGAPLIISFIHYLDETILKSDYRVNENLSGFVFYNSEFLPCDVIRTVTKKINNKKIDFDWQKIENDLILEGILINGDRAGLVKIASTVKILNFISYKVGLDKFYLLSAVSRELLNIK